MPRYGASERDLPETWKVGHGRGTPSPGRPCVTSIAVTRAAPSWGPRPCRTSLAQSAAQTCAFGLISGKSHDYVTSAHQVGCEARQSQGPAVPWPYCCAAQVGTPSGAGQMDVIEIEGMMETFAAIVVAAVVVLFVVLGILMVALLIGFVLSFL